MQRARALNRLEQAGMTVFAIRNLLHDMGNVPYGQIDSILASAGIALGSTTYFSAKYLFRLGSSVINQLDSYITPDNPNKKRSRNISPDDEMVKRLRTEDDDMGRRRPAPGEPHANDAPAGNVQPNPRLRAQDRPDPSSDEPMTSLAVNLTQSAKTQGRGHGSETGLENIPVSRFHPYDKTIQAILPYHVRRTSSFATAGCTSHSYRLNSIYDVEAIYAQANIVIPVADTADATPQTPFMRKYWTSIYQYWSVVSAKWKVSVYLTTESINNSAMIYVYEHGVQLPPAVNPTDTKPIHHQIKKRHPNVRYKEAYCKPKILDSGGVDDNDNGYHVNKGGVHFSGTWYPGKIQHEVKEDELVQTWHTPLEVPPTREGLTVQVQHSPHSAASIPVSYIIEFAIEYTVQFKDLIGTLQYLTHESDVPVIENFATQVNT